MYFITADTIYILNNYNGLIIFNEEMSRCSKLILGDIFNHRIDNLPSNITWLHTGNCFNQPINLSHCSLKYLVLGRDFNCPVDNLPYSLEYL